MRRRGTKENPFDVGEVVIVRRTNKRAIVSGVRIADYTGTRLRRQTQIKYTLRLIEPATEYDDQREYIATELEEP